MLGVAEAALGCDFVEGKVGVTKKQSCLCQPAPPDFRSWWPTQFRDKATVQPYWCHAKFTSKLVNAPLARQILLHQRQCLRHQRV